jgi:hypothetical protein
LNHIGPSIFFRPPLSKESGAAAGNKLTPTELAAGEVSDRKECQAVAEALRSAWHDDREASKPEDGSGGERRALWARPTSCDNRQESFNT